MAAPSGQLTLTGLPFTVFNNAANAGPLNFQPFSGWAVTMTQPASALVVNTTTAQCFIFATGGSNDAAGALAANAQTRIEGTYSIV